MAPAAAEGRFDSVIELAGRHEAQNPGSRDVHWYRVWRAAAMIGLGQVDEGEQLIDSVLSEVSQPGVNVADSGRLRMFAADQKAKAALTRNKPAEALTQLERAVSIAADTSVDGGPCARPLVLAGRWTKIGDISMKIGDGARLQKARGRVQRYVEDWSLCLTKLDYPGNQSVTALVPKLTILGAAPAPAAMVPVAAPVATVATPIAKPVAKPVAEPAPPKDPPAGEAPAATPEAVVLPEPPATPQPKKGLTVVRAKYAPIAATPWQPHIDTIEKLLKRRDPSLVADTMIRTDGVHRALRLRMKAKNVPESSTLVPIFKGTVIFFENTRDVDPSLSQVLISIETASGTRHVLANKTDIIDLFVDRIDEATFIDRLVSPR